jgi:FkbM family methyltransferase
MTASVSRLRRALSGWLWRRRRLTWQLPSGLHVRVESLSDWVIYNEVFVDRAYDEAIELALATAPTDRPLVVLDLGAHVGYFSLHVADRVRQLASSAGATIAMVEGHPDTFETLASRWRQQPLDPRTQVHLVRGLAGSRTGIARVTSDAFTAAAHVAGQGEPGVGATYVDLNIVAPGTGPIDLLKCDVEGAEAQVIAEYPALLARVRHAAIEFHPRCVDVDALLARLAATGLRQTRVVTKTPDGSLRLFAR